MSVDLKVTLEPCGGPAIVSEVLQSGELRPSYRPVRHATMGAAVEEAKRLAKRHLGKSFAVLRIDSIVLASPPDLPTSALFKEDAAVGWYEFHRYGDTNTEGTPVEAKYALVGHSKTPFDSYSVRDVVFMDASGNVASKPDIRNLRWKYIDRAPAFVR